MTNQEHPITPPPALVHQWADMLNSRSDQAVFSFAARWGADQELEACCNYFEDHLREGIAKDLRTARRPKPPTLKEQALDALRVAESTGCLYVNGSSDLIRRALEALPDELERQ
jgi:hypothetical protein